MSAARTLVAVEPSDMLLRSKSPPVDWVLQSVGRRDEERGPRQEVKGLEGSEWRQGGVVPVCPCLRRMFFHSAPMQEILSANWHFMVWPVRGHGSELLTRLGGHRSEKGTFWKYPMPAQAPTLKWQYGSGSYSYTTTSFKACKSWLSDCLASPKSIWHLGFK